MGKRGVDSPLVRFNVLSLPVTKVRTDVLVVGIFSDVRPLRGLAAEIDWIHQGVLSRLILGEKISGKVGETILLATQRKLPTSKVLIQGLGDKRSFNGSSFHSSNMNALASVFQLGVRRCALELFGINQSSLGTGDYVEIMTEVIRRHSDGKDLEASLLVPGEDKAREVRQQLIERSVVV